MDATMMMMKRILLLSLAVLSSTNASHTPYGYQSGRDDGHSYSGGMAYDKNHHLLYLTGQTYGQYFFGKALGIEEGEVKESNCFMGIIKLPDQGSKELEWLEVQEMGNNSVVEACSSLVHASNSKVYAVGHSEEHGIIPGIRPFGTTKSKVYGTVAEFDVDVQGDSLADTTASMSLQGGRLLHSSGGVHYPVAVALEPNEDTIFMASINSEDKELSSEQPRENVDKPDLTFHPKYGSDYKIIIERLVPLDPPETATDSKVDLKETLSVHWEEFLSAKDDDENDVAVYVMALEYVNRDTLLFAGSTKGSGLAFGAGAKSTADDMDGFITKINPGDGKIPTNLPKYSIRIGSDQDDMVNALCHHENDVYVVGTTHGLLGEDDTQTNTASDAFVMKLDLDTLDIVWIRQIGAVTGPHTPDGAEPHVHGIACAVTHNGTNVYIAGNVESGGILTGENIPGAYSLGGSDVFVAQVSRSGELEWAVQTGTSKNERVAHGGGIVVDANDNAILMGNTNGAMIRNKDVESDSFTDVFFQSFGKENGEHMESIELLRGKHENISRPSSPPNVVPVATPAPTVKETEVVGTGAEATEEANASSNDDGGGVSAGAIFLIVILSLGFLLLFVFVVRRTRQEFDRKHRNRQFLDPVSPYLNNFSYGEVDMKHSATGGWHGIYTNPKLAPEGSQGMAKSYREELEEINFRSGAPPSYDSSFVKDSLFMDDLDVPNLGDHHSPGSSNRDLQKDEEEDDEDSKSSRQLSTYDDLLDAYNTTWDDLNPHKLPSNASGLPMPGRGGNKGQSEAEGLLDKDEGWGTEII